MANGVPRSGELTTANYGWTKPNVGNSDDAWGGMINADLDGIDSTMKSVSNVASAAVPLAGGTMTGLLTVPNISAPQAIGENRVINGNFAINQRGQVSGTALVAAAYGHDRWKAGAAGCTYTFTAAVPDTTVTITAGTLTQVIEAGVIEGGVYTLSWTGTAQARVYQGTPTGSYAASPIVTASLPAGTNTIVEFNTGTVVKVKFEIGTVATSFNRSSLAKSLADCQRYFCNTLQAYFAAYGTAGGSIGQSLTFPVTMRISPAVTFNTASLMNCTGLGQSLTPTVSDISFFANVTATGMAAINLTNIIANAEL